MITASGRSGPQVRCHGCATSWSWPLPLPGVPAPDVLPCPHCGAPVQAPDVPHIDGG